jgi:type IV pilus assembly protein PilX
MSARHLRIRTRQQGLVLVSSLLLLLVITILALAMFRSMGLGEKISGNVREKQRALHAAVFAEQYAEWWLSSSGNGGAIVACSSKVNVNTAGASSVLICNQASAIVTPATLPWTIAGGAQVGFSYYPISANLTTTMNFVPDSNGSYANTYTQAPAFYIQYMGLAKDGGGNVYKIDAVGYGGSPLSVAVVESTYEMGSAVTNPGNP